MRESRAVTGLGRGGGVVLLACASLALTCGPVRVPLQTVPDLSPAESAALEARGRYLVRDVSVCGQCHAAEPAEDPDGPLSGGREFENWRIGTARASNLTPDPETGLGRWSDAEIVRALRNGQSRDGRLLAPVMPYEWFHGMSDRDALAVARYLRTLPPVRNEVEQEPSFWFRLARLFLGPEPVASLTAPPPGPTAEYGGYLARHVGLCADCHTPRTGRLRPRPDRERLFAGRADPPEGFPANPSNLTPDPETGIATWSEEELLRTLRTGENPQGERLHPFMPWEQVRRMTDEDLRAIYRYLQSLPPIRNEVPREPRPESRNS